MTRRTLTPMSRDSMGDSNVDGLPCALVNCASERVGIARPQIRSMTRFGVCIAIACAFIACDLEPQPDGRDQQVGYRDGTSTYDYTSSGERGNVQVSEVFWAGSVEGTMSARVHDPGDVFIELQNKHPRPMYFTGWIITIVAGDNLDTYGPYRGTRERFSRSYVLPAPEHGQPTAPNGYAVIAARRDGAFRNADFYLEDLVLPESPFEIVLQDRDERLIDHVGDVRKTPFAGSWDLVTARSMERIQLIFGNRGNTNAAWHSYSLNTWNTAERDGVLLHELLRQNVHPDYRELTYATPGMPNSPDYSGNVSSGSFE